MAQLCRRCATQGTWNNVGYSCFNACAAQTMYRAASDTSRLKSCRATPRSFTASSTWWMISWASMALYMCSHLHKYVMWGLSSDPTSTLTNVAPKTSLSSTIKNIFLLDNFFLTSSNASCESWSTTFLHQVADGTVLPVSWNNCLILGCASLCRGMFASRNAFTSFLAKSLDTGWSSTCLALVPDVLCRDRWCLAVSQCLSTKCRFSNLTVVWHRRHISSPIGETENSLPNSATMERASEMLLFAILGILNLPNFSNSKTQNTTVTSASTIINKQIFNAHVYFMRQWGYQVELARTVSSFVPMRLLRHTLHQCINS